MHSKSNNLELMTYDKAEGVIEEISESPFSRYQIGLATSRKGRDFIFDCVIYYNIYVMKKILTVVEHI